MAAGRQRGTVSTNTTHRPKHKTQTRNTPHLGEDAEEDQPARAGESRVARRAPRESDDAVVLREGGVWHAGHEGREEAGDAVAEEAAPDPLPSLQKRPGRKEGRKEGEMKVWC